MMYASTTEKGLVAAIRNQWRSEAESDRRSKALEASRQRIRGMNVADPFVRATFRSYEAQASVRAALVS